MSLRRLAAGACSIALCALSVGAQRATPEWPVAPASILSLGGDGGAATEFLRITATFRLSTGLIAVVNSGTNEIRLFDEKGIFVRAFGRAGGGPGEFRSISWAGRSGDTAFVYDASLRRITIVLLGREPHLLETRLMTATGGRYFGVSDRLADGRWLVTTGVSPGFDGPPGVHRLPGWAGTMAPDATGQVTWLGEFQSGAVFVLNESGDIKQAMVGLTAFSPWFHASPAEPYVWLGESGSDSLVRVDVRDGKRSTLRLPFTRRSPSDALIVASRTRALVDARGDRSRAFVEAQFSPKYLPRDLPYYASLSAGPGGELWVQEFNAMPSTPAHYLVIGADASVRASVRVPAGFRVKEIGLDYVLGVQEDADGVESAQLLRLSRR
jgi:hypothetical protein